MPRMTVPTAFDCGHQRQVKVLLDADVIVPDGPVRGLGKCEECMEEERVHAVSGVAPGPGGTTLTLDSIMLIAIEG